MMRFGVIRKMSLLSLPCELIELVCLETDFETIRELFRSRVVTVLDDEMFWARKAHKDIGFPIESYFKRSIVEQEIPLPNFLMIRYVEVVSRRGIVSDSLLFLSRQECLRRAVKNRNYKLIKLFKGPLKHKYHVWRDAILGQALMDGHGDIFRPLIGSYHGTSFDFYLGFNHIVISRYSTEHTTGWVCSLEFNTIEELRTSIMTISPGCDDEDRDMIVQCTLAYHGRSDLLMLLPDVAVNSEDIWETVGRTGSLDIYRSVLEIVPFDDEDGYDEDRVRLLKTALEIGDVDFIKGIIAPSMLRRLDEMRDVFLSPACLEVLEFLSEDLEERDACLAGCPLLLKDVNKITSLAVKKLLFRLQEVAM